jgi:hypothetical protein
MVFLLGALAPLLVAQEDRREQVNPRGNSGSDAQSKKNLWAAVLTLAIEDLAKGNFQDDRRASGFNHPRCTQGRSFGSAASLISTPTPLVKAF